MALPRPPLNRHPIGLLDFFGIKNGGRYPEDLINTLQPTLDLVQWYAQTASETFNLSAANIVATTSNTRSPWTVSTPTGLPNPLVVPDTELWLVTHYAASIPLATPNAFWGTVSFEETTGRFVDLAATFLTPPTAAVSGVFCAAMVSPLVFVPPGSRMYLYISQATAGAGAIIPSGQIRLKRMRI